MIFRGSNSFLKSSLDKHSIDLCQMQTMRTDHFKETMPSIQELSTLFHLSLIYSVEDRIYTFFSLQKKKIKHLMFF